MIASSERFLRRVDTLKGFEDSAGQGAGLLEHPVGERGMSLDEVIELLEREVVRPGAATATGRHLAYIPGGGIYHSALGDYLAAVSNKYSGVFFAGPGPVRMENLMVRWVADLVGYPTGAAGSIASGGSLATLTAIVSARVAHGLRAAEFATSVVYLTRQAHYCVEKALHIAGMAEAQVRWIPMDERYRMRPDALAAAVAEDRSAGLRPWLVVAAAGTTDTGAVDPLVAIADVAERERCWFHVDAAYGGFFLLTEQGRVLLEGIERSDSVVLDPHKGLFLPYGSGIVVVKDSAPLLRGTTTPAATCRMRGRTPASSRRRTYRRSCRGTSGPSACGCRSRCSVPLRSGRRWRRSCCSRATSTGRSRARGSRSARRPTSPS